MLTETAVEHHLELLTCVIRLLLTTISQQRQRTLMEEGVPCEMRESIGLPNGDYFL